ncbi:hypothetical protein AB0469_31720 [Streptomyces sp. NPDC093801]|uniref:hypothetical protein n=1 Tax=Streptomyces sp. NPDC093801 TaxID=3155203 RepID=UPI00345032D6
MSPLTTAERQFLRFALDLAADHMAVRGDEFTDEDDAALARLRQLAAASAPGPVTVQLTFVDAEATQAMIKEIVRRDGRGSQ